MNAARSLQVVTVVILLLATGCNTEKLSTSGDGWARRLSGALIQGPTPEGRSELVSSCTAARDWHNARDDENEKVEDWIILSEVCDQALQDNDWDGALERLTKARP